MSEFLTTGVQLRIETAPGPPVQYAAVEGVRSIRGPSRARETVEVTNLNSTAREFISGLRGEGSFTIDFYPRRHNNGLYPPGQQAIENSYNDGSLKSFEYLVPLGAQTRTYRFNGYVSALEYSSEAGEAQQASATITISGPITITVS